MLHIMFLSLLQWSLSLLLLPRSIHAFDATPRWGQATVVLHDALFVHGGKTDEFNSYSYTSAPNTNDVLYLPLTDPFSADSPPWQLVSSSANSTTSQGPALAWHTLSAFDTSDILLFGGQPGPNSPTVIVGSADSAGLLDVFSRLNPVWSTEPISWAGEPVRRIRHSTATAPSGLVFIIGGEKADGSGSAFSDHFVFDSRLPTFRLLPSENGPPDLYGHTSIILPDGRIFVFGGYCPSQGNLLPFSTIWVLDTTQSPLSWTELSISTDSLFPSPRIAFVAVLLGDGRILIQGGSDATLQTNLEDGWILDTKTMTWTPVEVLSQLGARRDHFAICVGDEVVFGFGYQNNGPAPAPLQIYNTSSGSFTPSFTPLPVGTIPTPTLPVHSQTSQANTPKPTGPTTGVHPTSTLDPSNPNPGGNNGRPTTGSGSTSRTTAIAVGSAFGILGLLAICIGVAYYVRRKRREKEGESQFMALGGDEGSEGGDSPHFDGEIPVVGMHGEDGMRQAHRRGLLNSLGITGAIGAASKMMTVGNNHERRDMLADEDTRDFGEWYTSRRRDGTGGSSWSLRSILGGGARLVSRHSSTTSRGTGGVHTPWREKTDPFSDGASYLRDEETGFVGAAAAGSRPHARREMSYASSRSGMSFRDPFADPIQEERRQRSETSYLSDDDEGYNPIRPSARPVANLTPLRTVLPISQGGHALSPLSEHTSQNTLPLQEFSTSGSSHAHSSENAISPFGSMSRASTRTSADPLTPGSSISKTTSIVGAASNGYLETNQPMRRSDSWWSRFARTSLLDRKASDASRKSVGGRYEIRDPNPPPRLGAIAESVHSAAAHTHSGSGTNPKNSPDSHLSSPGAGALGKAKSLSKDNSINRRLYGTGHGKSMSSVRTADSEAIERMAGTMDVVQRVKTRSHRTTGSTSSAGGRSIDTHMSSLFEDEGQGPDDDLMMFASPVEMSPNAQLPGPSTPPRLSSPPPPASKGSQPGSTPPEAPTRTFSPTPQSDSNSSGAHSKSSVADRVQAFERRLSHDQALSSPPPPTNTKQHEERSKKRVSVDYGLVPRASLFVANPDRNMLSGVPSEDSMS
ncbi:hypothetical protein B0H34DRAFT_678582 [Crassisporium funariophilum]|nr:hypothetical protein B0H34DRAFT_678582 [Crassisporium funariophilum]